MSRHASGGDHEALRALLEEIAQSIGTDAEVQVEEKDGELWGRFEGDDVGPLIGRRGQTIDAIQHLAQRIVGGRPLRSTGSGPDGAAGGEHRGNDLVSRMGEGRDDEGGHARILIDADGYRERRAATLREEADEAADEAIRTGETVELEPMSSSERRIVHEHLRERGDVSTRSEGQEPERRLLVSPLAGDQDVSRFSSR